VTAVAVLERLVGGLGGFLFALVVVAVARRVLPRRSLGARAGLLLAAVPFAKLALSAFVGLPADVRAHALSAPRTQPGAFELGVGMTPLGALVRVVVTRVAEGTQEVRGSAGLLASAIARVHPAAPGALAAGLVLAGLVSVVRRAYAAHVSASLVRAALRGATHVGTHRAGGRAVPVWVSEAVTGSPFTGGFVAPYIVFPRATWEVLSAEERAAALAHELGHVREGHVLVAALAGLVASSFVFLPFVARAEQRLRAALESAADERAVADGACPYALASALVRVREHVAVGAVLPTLTLGAGHASLGARVKALLEEPAPSSRGQALAGLALAAAVALVALRAVVLP